MEPINFDEVNKKLLKPNSMTDEQCKSLPVFTDGSECISKWKLSFKERLHCLVHGYIWARVLSGGTQPPISLRAEKTVFESKDDK